MFKHIGVHDQVELVLVAQIRKIPDSELEILQAEVLGRVKSVRCAIEGHIYPDYLPVWMGLRQGDRQIASTGARIQHAQGPIVQPQPGNPPKHVITPNPSWYMQFPEKPKSPAFQRIGLRN